MHMWEIRGPYGEFRGYATPMGTPPAGLGVLAILGFCIFGIFKMSEWFQHLYHAYTQMLFESESVNYAYFIPGLFYYLLVVKPIAIIGTIWHFVTGFQISALFSYPLAFLVCAAYAYCAFILIAALWNFVWRELLGINSILTFLLPAMFSGLWWVVAWAL